MHIFNHPNYNFLRWRWHAIALSWVIIIAGLVMIKTKGIPLSTEFSGGTEVIAAFDQPTSVNQVRSRARQVVPRRRRHRPDLRQPGAAANHDSRADGGRRIGHVAQHDEGRRRRRAHQGRRRRVSHRRHRDRRPVGRPGAEEQGLLGDGAVARRHPAVPRVPLPVQLRGRRRRRDDSRSAGDARVPGVLPLRPVAERHRGHPDDDRLLDQRHDRHLRPDPREPAVDAARLAERDHQRLGEPDAGPDGHHRRARRC